MNHAQIYRTRTKPKSAQPFFNAGTERFVRDWRTTEIIVSVRDRREHENDPLLGVVYLPLKRVFEKRSQFMDSFPIAGGIGYGRARISMVWRSVDCQLPPALLGWDYGTLEVKAPIRLQGSSGGDDKILGTKIHLHTNIARAKMKSPSSDGTWVPKRKDRESVFLAVSKRYRAPLVVEFRKSSALAGDSTHALAVIWLHDIPDEEEKTLSLDVWKGGKDQLKRAQSCADYDGLEDGEQPLGKVELSVKFWRGLSGYHKGYAGKSRNAHIRDAMEVLDTVNGEGLAMEDEGDEYDDSDSDSSASELETPQALIGSQHADRDQDDVNTRDMLRKANADSNKQEEDDPQNFTGKLKKRATSLVIGDDHGEDDGSRGPRAQLRDYKAHHKQLHRKHRGVMQWKATRTLDWMAGKVSRGKSKVGEVLFEHGDKDVGIETEV
ncbi:unnamed protein product [Parascedosporium putredinis]|uniref:C2 domain-containing protein n=1 Tax=Parascedosporium putredinis TaxID=1442378 RepID=A0A9P1H9G8_9PEZI|nr:unnamed protein product [Parascedosporium putredinis]CAI8000191.1 unnamed protein product [Parascedosporium putredinis]